MAGGRGHRAYSTGIRDRGLVTGFIIIIVINNMLYRQPCAMNHQQINASTNQRINASTHQRINASTHQQINHMLDLTYIRSQFPGLNSDWVLFDNAGGSQILKPVVDRIDDHFYTSNVQLGGSYPHSVLANERHMGSHKLLAEWINADDPREIVMGSATSLLIKILADNYRRVWKEGDEIIVTNCDHEANIGAWRDLASYGMVVKEWRLNPETFELEKEELLKLITDRTKLVAFTAASNVLGTINPVKEFTEIAHSHGALVCIDAVAYAPHCLVDVKDTNVDFFVFSFYKTYGPHYAMMYGKLDLLNELPGINHFFINEPPYKFQPGNYNFELCYGSGAIPEYFRDLAPKHGYNGKNDTRSMLEYAYSLIAGHEELLSKTLLGYLNNKPGIKIIGSKEFSRKIRVPTVSFIKEGSDSEQITLRTDRDKVAIRWGDFYARRLIDDLELSKMNGVVRISMVHYNNTDEIQRVIEALEKVL